MKVALCCIGKLENDYIREFVEYYKKLHVDKIFLYDNNDDSSDCNVPCGTVVENKDKEEYFEEVINDYIEDGFVELIDFRCRKICQLEAYQDCYDKHGVDYDWIMFFDCDEFMEITSMKTQDVKAYLGQKIFSQFDIIHINMCTYDDNNLLEPDGRGCLERFTHRAEGEKACFNNGVKSIVRGGLTNIKWISTPHTPISKYRTCDGLGVEIEKGNSPFYPPNTDGAYLKHFKTKTITEYILNKVVKGYPDQSDLLARGKLTIENFFKHNEYTKEKEELANKLLKNVKIKNELYIEAHIICFNEEQITPFAIQYWKRNFNHVYIYDNGSTDGTLDILRKEPYVTIYHFDTKDTFDDSANIYIKNNCWKRSKADFVIVSDFDEFIYSPDLKKELQYMSEHKMNIARLTGFDMVCDEFPKYDENKLTIETIQMGSLNEMMCKPILFNPHAFREINYCCGAHFCNPEGDVRWYDGNKIFLLHHKFLSLLYMAGRYLYLGKRLSQYNINGKMGVQYFWDEERKKKEFDFVKDSAINVYEYTKSDIEKAKSSICVSIISGTLDHMMFQILYGAAYATVYNKDFYCYAKTKEDFEFFSQFRSTIFKYIRCVDNLRMFSPRKFKRLSNLVDNIEGDVIFEANSNIFNTTSHAFAKALFPIEDKVKNRIKEVYSEIDFSNAHSMYVGKNHLTDSNYNTYMDKERTKTLVISSDDIEWATGNFHGDNIYQVNKTIDRYPKEAIDLIIQTLCASMDSSSCDMAKWAEFLKDND